MVAFKDSPFVCSNTGVKQGDPSSTLCSSLFCEWYI